MRAIAFYLPQFHPIPENDRWWGKNFTEWTNVRKAKPLFRGHYQPNVPGDLGYYDLRQKDVRRAQADLAAAHGIGGFCYWHYWFGGQRLLERPFNEVLNSGEPDFPFCLGWANESWTGVWHGDPGMTLMEQVYPGRADEENHFRLVEKAFHDPRYITIDGKPVFYIYKPHQIPDCQRFVEHWQKLAIKSGLKGVFFVGEDVYIDEEPWDYKGHGFDAVVPNSPGVAFLRLAKKRYRPRYLIPRLIPKLLNHPATFKYKDFIEHNRVDPGHEDFFPCVVSNWDNSPRSGRRAYVLVDPSPELLRLQLQRAVEQVEYRSVDRRLVFIKSWNEWAEGNYLEPDQRFGNGMLEVCRAVLGG